MLTAVLLSGCASASKDGAGAKYNSLADLAGKRIGILQGTWYDTIAPQVIPGAELNYFNSLADIESALNTDKIDSFLLDEPIITELVREGAKLKTIPEPVCESFYAFAFAKSEEGLALRSEFNVFLNEIKSNGRLKEIEAEWTGTDDSVKDVEDYTAYPAVNGTLTMFTSASSPPFTYVLDGRVAGYDIEVAEEFCKERGYGLDIQIAELSGMVPALQSGKADFVGAALTVTKERAENVLFSDSTYTCNVLAAVRSDASPAGSFFSSVAESFRKTFIVENRWMLFLEGVGTTMLITVLSIIFGTLLGFGIYMACRNGNKVANVIARFFVWLIHGMPVVVLLMILYYIIFSKAPLDGTAVSIVGFTLIFGSSVYSMLKAGVMAIDYGQTEAAYALGYGSRKAFFRIVLPQAMPHFMPAYKDEIVSLIKATAVVGYIAVQDLTKMGDIVRNRTYEAFFPLIAVAIIYFVIAGLLTFIVGKIQISFDPKRRTEAEILRGVVTHD